MIKSPLTDVTYPAYEGNFTYGRSGRKIECITIHHMAGVLTAKQCGEIFQTPGRCGSSHYGIGKDGEIACYVGEENTAWTNSNWDSNCKSITIETSNSEYGGKWKVSDYVLNELIKLVADIGKRNNLGLLVKGKNVTWHSMFAKTNCPGEYLLSKMDYIINEANKINNSNIKGLKYKIGDIVKINKVYVSSESLNPLTPLVNKGTITKIIEKARNPYLLNNGNIGWINDSCIVNEIKNIKTITNCYYLNLRKTPEFGNNIYSVVQSGTKVEYLGLEKGWAKIKYNNQILYCGINYLK